jgi:hypothetical protein
MNTPVRSRLAVLGTLADMHLQPLTYDLDRLRTIVAELAPDLLCAEVTRDAWEKEGLSYVGFEIREALAPLVDSSDIVLVPVASSSKQFADYTPSPGWRRNLVSGLDRILRWGQRKADRPEAINGVTFGSFCHTVCWLTEKMWTAGDRKAWETQNQAMAENILQALRRDPGCRALVTLRCQRQHAVLSLLRAHTDELEIVDYREL